MTAIPPAPDMPTPPALTPVGTILPARRPRIAGLDAARGVAIAAMVVFHTARDLDRLGLVDLGVADSAGWRWFARSIAASFLILVGIGLVRAHGDGIRWPAFWRRFALVAGGAALVSLGTWFAIPQAFVYFGILHSIALSSLIGLAFLRLPWPALLALAAAALAVPLLPGVPRVDGPAVWWLGLAQDYRPSVDYLPILPWIAPVLAGMALAKLVAPRLDAARWEPEGWPARILVAAGQWSLPIYLLHQPLIYGALWLAAQVLAGPIPASEREFAVGCERTCLQSGAMPALCASACPCTARSLREEGLLEAAITERLDARQTDRMRTLATQCLRAAVEALPRETEPAAPPATSPPRP